MERPERLDTQSADGAQLNLDALYQIAPSCFTEATDPKSGKIKRVVNFDVLRQLLGDDAVEDATEAYEFNWVGKQEARAEVLRPICKTLRPVKEDSVDWDNTQNLYIEGDNLEVLKLLQKSYLGKVKMIYIDPPYNTGNDFVYHDDSSRSQEEEDLAAGNIDDLGNRYRKNTDSNGRFHSEWCSMIYARLMVARSLLKENGVIFISIDENEITNMSKICDEVFGRENFIDTLHWKKKKQPSFLAKHTAKVMEYVLVYAKSANSLEKLSTETLSDATKKVINISNAECTRHFKSNVRVKIGDYGILPKGRYRIKTMDVEYLQDVHYENGYTTNEVDVVARFSVSQDKIDNYIDNDLLFITANKGLRRDVSEEEKGNRKSITDLLLSDYGDNQESDNEFKELFENKYFDYTKPINLIYNFVKSNFTDNEVVLDFFSGSATSAHAVMQLNAEDGGNRKFIMVQLPEKTPEDSEAFIAGYKNICEIGKERIRRAGKKIKEEHPEAKDLDTGFRVFRIDESNFENVERTPKDYNQDELDLFLNNIKSDRSDLDLLFGCMLDWGVQLSLPMNSEEVDGKMIYTVNDGDLVACFADKVTDKVVKAMADKQPLRVIFRDSCFDQDADKINIYETFKQLLDWSDKDVEKNIRVI
ncbi:site-specific DNA-methyltransferase [Segatella bryantii]|uniref:site-specific DNA-methyltransferase n=1 Tax=Segatella bryantii TaxID=77095 RepID=UPI001EDC6F90|nr:site-specific DNA-methyltransferase [Segatella bryantii]UKK73376.1 site-specific DNA-methyltransferase [Segatella bryantii]